MPLLQQHSDELPAAPLGFAFPCCAAAAAAAAASAEARLRNLSLPAAQWPSWTAHQAAVPGLLCARRGLDLRTRAHEQRLACGMAAGTPLRPRVECGPCCGDGYGVVNRAQACGDVP
ncbi:hypothetical protein ABZ916_24245 [Streptomyces sp. NPDC046853]|uniref:hypothetical protein n=1 Tax=Streptomyces sp. NPDC046853 TaxID=3154920 RepID=UPI0033E7D9C2